MAQFADGERQALEALLDAFGEVCSLEEIASAYSRSKGNIIIAGDILGKSHDAKSEIAQSDGENSNSNSNSNANNNIIEIQENQETNSRFSKSKKASASLGTVSTMLGNSYASRRSIPVRAEMVEKSKPIKIELPKSVLDFESESNLGPKRDCLSSREIEQFLFSMLGDGFKLSMDVIKDVLGSCGYDIKKSMEELLDFTTSRSLEKGKSIDDWTAEYSGVNKEEAPVPVENPPNSPAPNPPNPTRNRISAAKRDNLSHEVLKSLFTVPKRVEEEPFKPRFELGINRNRETILKPVTKPLIDNVKIPLPVNMVLRAQLADMDDLVEDDEYNACRETTKQHWASMKEYYGAAIAAFTEGKHQDASYLLEQGKHYFQLAREFEEKSARHLDETRQVEKEEEEHLSLDVTVVEPSDAVYLLKVHLCKLANISSIQYLKVVIGPNNEDLKKTKIRRKVLRLLEKESVKWTEDEANPGTISIQLDQIDLSKLSFAHRFTERDV